jgi:hypothetical protein
MWLFNNLVFKSFEYEHIWWKLFQKRVVRTKIGIYVFITIDTSAGGLLVPEGIILPDFCWWIISPRGYQPAKQDIPSSKVIDAKQDIPSSKVIHAKQDIPSSKVIHAEQDIPSSKVTHVCESITIFFIIINLLRICKFQ